MKQFEGMLQKDRDQLYYYHVIVPKDIVSEYQEQAVSRFKITFNQLATVSGALIPKGDGAYFIIINKALRKKFGWEAGSEMEVQLEPDESKYGMPMPEELEELLLQDPEGDMYFHELTPGKQRNLIYMVSKPKGVDTRIKKALVIVQHLKEVKGQLDFKMLNEAYKRWEW